MRIAEEYSFFHFSCHYVLPAKDVNSSPEFAPSTVTDRFPQLLTCTASSRDAPFPPPPHGTARSLLPQPLTETAHARHPLRIWGNLVHRRKVERTYSSLLDSWTGRHESPWLDVLDLREEITKGKSLNDPTLICRRVLWAWSSWKMADEELRKVSGLATV